VQDVIETILWGLCQSHGCRIFEKGSCDLRCRILFWNKKLYLYLVLILINALYCDNYLTFYKCLTFFFCNRSQFSYCFPRNYVTWRYTRKPRNNTFSSLFTFSTETYRRHTEKYQMQLTYRNI